MRSRAAMVRAVLRHAPKLPETGTCAVCGKKTFATREAAEYVLYRCQWYGTPRAKTETRTYWSRNCGWWHLTSRDDEAARAAAEERNGN